MNRSQILAAGLAAAALILAIVAFFSMRQSQQPALPAFDYAKADAWAYRPEPATRPVWETGWASDVLVFSDRVAVTALSRLSTHVKAGAGINESLTALGPVYMPYVRKLEADADFAAALQAYATNDNRGRAFLIVTDRPISAAAVAQLQTDAALRERFGGFVLLSQSADEKLFDETAPMDVSSVCPPQWPDVERCVRVAQLQTIGETETARLTEWLAYLEANAAQLAPPLGDFEAIETIEIRSPGDTDEARGAAEK